MAPLWLTITVALYLMTAFDLYQKGEIGLAVTFVAYAMGNLGLIAAARGI